MPIDNYPWVVFYRKSLFAEKGYTIPTTLDEFKALATKMQADGLDPARLRRQATAGRRWARSTSSTCAMNGYDFHVGLMAGKREVDRPEGQGRLREVDGAPPYHQEARPAGPGRTPPRRWSRRRPACTSSGMFVVAAVQAADEADLADLDFFPYPDFGTECDAEKALDAPIDGFMLSPTRRSGEPRRRQGVPGVPRASRRRRWPGLAGQGQHRGRQGRRHERLHRLQKKAAEIIGGAQRITQFLDRDTNPNFAGPNGMQAFLLDFLKNPNQDLDAFLAKIQGFWDTLLAAATRLAQISRPWPIERLDRRPRHRRRSGAAGAAAVSPSTSPAPARHGRSGVATAC